MYRVKVPRKLFLIIGISCAFYFSIFTNRSFLSFQSRFGEVPGRSLEKNISLSKEFHIHGDFIKERRTFPKHKECQNYTTRLYEEGTFNKTALVSYPGSGNTWLRHLIEMATGVFTGSVYFDATLLARGFLGEKEDWSAGSTIVQKLHLDYNKAHGFKKGILLIRDPIAAARSFVQYLESGHTGWASPNTFLKKEWPIYILQSTYKWITLAKTWLESTTELLVIHYENLREFPKLEVSKVCEFLQLDCSRIESKCFQMNIEGSFHRKRPIWKTRTQLLPSEVREKVDDGIDYLNAILVKYDKEPIPLSKYTHYRKKNLEILQHSFAQIVEETK